MQPSSGYSDADAKLNVPGFYGRHLVGIYSAYQDGSCDIASGFVMDVDGLWLLVTAGHVIGDLNRALAAGRLKKVRLLDGNGYQARWKHPYPLAYESAARTVIGNEEAIDYGLILLDELTMEGLKANNVVAMDEDHWKEPPDGFNQFLLIGLPSQFVKTRDVEGEPMICQAKVIVAVLESIETPPAQLRSDFRRIYARVPGDFDIGGMSGGPVMGVRRFEGGNKYWPIGVQSGWLESSRIAAICPFKIFADSVRNNLKKAPSRAGGCEPTP